MTSTLTLILLRPLLGAAHSTLLYSLISLAIWLLVLVWIYNIARRKGRHALGWLILGLFFSLLALIVVALLPSKVTTEHYRAGRL